MLFCKEGVKVMFCGRGEEVGKQIADECGPSAYYMRCDVNVEHDIKVVVDKTVELWGRIDCLFNNAGGGTGPASVTQMSREFIHRAFSLNFDSMALAMRHAVPHMKKQPRSSIINNSSIAAKRAGYGDPLYSAAKAAMDSYGRAAAMELAKDGIRVNSVSPGATATPIFWSGSPGSARGKTLSADDNAARQRKVEQNIVDNV